MDKGKVTSWEQGAWQSRALENVLWGVEMSPSLSSVFQFSIGSSTSLFNHVHVSHLRENHPSS